MKDILQDLVAHTHALGFLPVIKINATDKETKIESLSEKRTVVLTGKTNVPVGEFEGTFGMPNLNKLDLHLKNPEYKENSKIEMITAIVNDETIPAGIRFENEAKDFINEYKFMNAEVINATLKTVKFKGAQWDIEFEPSVIATTRLKLQAQAHVEEDVFQVKTDKDNLIFYFGDASTHAGSFIFQSGISGKLKQIWSYPVNEVISILSLGGDKVMGISDTGAMQITVNSGLAVYDYILPAQAK